jgi:hypothetical protein
MSCNLTDFSGSAMDDYREYYSNNSLRYKKAFSFKTNKFYELNDTDIEGCEKQYIADMIGKDLARWLMDNDYIKITQIGSDNYEYQHTSFWEIKGEVDFKLMETPRRYKNKLIIEKNERI